MKKRYWMVLAALTATVLSFSGCSDSSTDPKIDDEIHIAETSAAEQTEAIPPVSHEADSIPDYVDDFYNAVNHDLLESWEISEDEASISWFQILAEENYNKVNDIIQQVSSVSDYEEVSDMRNIRALNLTGLDRETREREGYGQKIEAFLKEVDDADTVSELLKVNLQFQRDYNHYCFPEITYSADSQESSVKILYFFSPETGLLREEWFSQNPNIIKNVEEYKKYLIKLHEIRGMAPDEAKDTVERVTGMMKDLASCSLYMEEQSNPQKTYNVYTAKDAAAIIFSPLPFSVLEDIFGCTGEEKAVIFDPELCKKMGEYYTQENLPLLKEYVKTVLYGKFSPMADTASMNAQLDYWMAVNGIKEKKDFERIISENTQVFLGFECGRLFCETYFSEEAKKDVEDIIRQIIEVYDQKLANMDWMSETTRQEARKKLGTITIKIGYPDTWPQDNRNLNLKAPEEGGVYIDNFLEIERVNQDYRFSTKSEPVDKARWNNPPQTVNASYNPTKNDITFPAGILQPPFYDPNAQPVINMGRIGMVIGHEITHAFDSNGSQFDEDGNLRNWWTSEDKEKFDELKQNVIDYYNTMEVNGIQVNGSLTVTENIADLGAISCITEIAKKQGYDIKELYKAYAVIWANKSRDEYLSNSMLSNVHAPGVVRVNAVLSTIEDFYNAFNVKEGDGMYQKPENRPKIW